MEQNKIRTYLIYALGEILLVVIGILIALQINTLYENKVNQTKKELYKESLIDDLKRDSTRLSKTIEFHKQTSEVTEAHRKRLVSPSANFDTLLVIARDEFSLYQDNIENFNTNTFQILTATGDISLFEETIIKQLYTLNDAQNNTLRIGSELYSKYLDEITVFNRSYPMSTEFSIFNSGPIHNDLWLDIDKKKLAKDFNALSLTKNNHLRVVNMRYSELFQQTVDMLELLNRKN